MSRVVRGAPSVLEGMRLVQARRRRAARAVAKTQPQPLMETFEGLRRQLGELGLWGDTSLLLLSGGGNRIVLDAQGKLVSSPLFERVRAPFALFSTGYYACGYSATGLSLRASTDDMAQLFGPQVACGDLPWADAPAFLVRDRGFLVTGRYEAELVAAAILIEKACRTELLAPRVGTPHYLSPALCLAERAVYLASYSRHEREASDGSR